MKKSPPAISFIGFYIAFVLQLILAIDNKNVLNFMAAVCFLIAGTGNFFEWLKSKKK